MGRADKDLYPVAYGYRSKTLRLPEEDEGGEQ